jgi:hypothetical protein
MFFFILTTEENIFSVEQISLNLFIIYRFNYCSSSLFSLFHEIDPPFLKSHCFGSSIKFLYLKKMISHILNYATYKLMIKNHEILKKKLQ